MAPWEQGRVHEADGGFAFHGPLTDGTGAEDRIPDQPSPEKHCLVPVHQDSRCRRCGEKHVTSPAQFIAYCRIDVRIQHQTLLPLEVTPWCPEGSARVHSTATSINPTAAMPESTSARCSSGVTMSANRALTSASISRATPKARTTRAGVGIRFKGWQNRTILLKYGQTHRSHDQR